MTEQQELGLKKGQKPFEGEYRAKMFELIQAGLTPWSPADVMDARNEVNSSHPLWHNYFDTDFGLAGTKKKIYLIPHSAGLRAVTPKTKLTFGGLPLQGDALAGARAYPRRGLILDCNLTEEEARSSPVWLDFADGDQKLLDKYVGKAFRFGKDQYGYDKMMGIFVPKEKKPIERAVVLDSVISRSQAYGSYHLFNFTRFVGVRKKSSNDLISAQECDNSSHSLRRRGVAAGDTEKNEVPPVPQETQIATPTMEQILACLGDDVAQSVKPKIEDRIKNLYDLKLRR